MKDNRVGKVTAIDDRLRSHRGNFFHVDKESVVPFAQEAWEDQVAVGTALIPLNWDEWYNALSSLVIPTEIRGVFFVRMVLTISFAGLFHLLKIRTPWTRLNVLGFRCHWLRLEKKRGTSISGTGRSKPDRFWSWFSVWSWGSHVASLFKGPNFF